MTKTKLWAEVQEILAKHKASKKLSEELEAILAPKAGGSVAQNPMRTIDGKNYHYCRYSGLYVIEPQMVMSKGKSKGYSKLAIAKWTKAGKIIQELNNEAMRLLLDGKQDEGKAKAKEAEELKVLRNEVKYYSDVRQELSKLGYALV